MLKPFKLSVGSHRFLVQTVTLLSHVSLFSESGLSSRLFVSLSASQVEIWSCTLHFAPVSEPAVFCSPFVCFYHSNFTNPFTRSALLASYAALRSKCTSEHQARTPPCCLRVCRRLPYGSAVSSFAWESELEEPQIREEGGTCTGRGRR